MLSAKHRECPMATPIEIRAKLKLIIIQAKKQGRPHVEVNAGEFHRMIGGYPPKRGQSHRMPMVCAAMREELARGKAEVIHRPARGQGASLTVRYDFPRPQ